MEGTSNLMCWVTGRSLKAARQSASRGDWATAAKHYESLLWRRPRAKIWVQYGHALKEQGDLDGALAAYDNALALAPHVPDTWLQKSMLLKRRGDRAMAVECCARAVELNVKFKAAIDELVALGGRDRLPEMQIEAQRAAGIFSTKRYHEYRSRVRVPVAPNDIRPYSIAVLINARDALPAEVRSTLLGLLEQSMVEWRATVFAPSAIHEHSVASLAAIDPRIRFVSSDTVLMGDRDETYLLLVQAGTVLDPQALGWFGYAAQRSDCRLAYSDHDHSQENWREGPQFDDPMFQPMFDGIWFANHGTAPAALLVDRCRARIPDIWQPDCLRQILVDNADAGQIAHIPYLLATVRGIPEEAERALPDLAYPIIAPPQSLASKVAPSLGTLTARIQVIVQTRDQPRMLDAAITSLRGMADRSNLLDI
ncbi:MAG: tetratricopeptide repeat protein, partial [Pseudomonadota bacterium]|nr:tetratricopeptide repeat protein [Pseudomonadota bacterium]